MSTRPERQGVQLAHPATERRISTIGLEGQCFAQPKLNGERFRVQWFLNEPFFISSYGNAFSFLDHLQKPLKEFAARTGLQPRLDGEIYKHGWPRERIDSALRRRKNFNPDVLELEAHVFDIQLESTMQYERFLQLYDLKNKHDLFTGPIKEVGIDVIKVTDWMEYCIGYISEGYEGIILRNPMSEYTNPGGAGVAKRSNGMLKFKPHRKDAYDIIGYEEGTGWAEGMLGSFLVKGADGTTFAVGTGPELTKPNRKLYWQYRDELIGRKLLVKYEPTKTSGGKPICTVAYRLLKPGESYEDSD